MKRVQFLPVPADLDPAVHAEQSLPAPDDFNYADLDLDDDWDPMQRYDCTPTAAATSAMSHTKDTLLASYHARPQHTQPQHAQPQYAQPQHAQPQHTQPQHAWPQHTQPQCAQPQHDHSVSTLAAAQRTTERWLPAGCKAQPQRYYSSGTPPAAEGTNSVGFQAADCDGQQNFAEFSSAEARQGSDPGATETAGMKRQQKRNRGVCLFHMSAVCCHEQAIVMS